MWIYAPSGSTTHETVHTPCASMHYLPESVAVLTASLAYGVVARSYPINGKVLKGILRLVEYLVFRSFIDHVDLQAS